MRTCAAVTLVVFFALSFVTVSMAQETPAAAPEAPAVEAAATPAIPMPAVESLEAAAVEEATTPVATPAPTPKFLVIVPESINREWFWFFGTDQSQHVVQSAIEKALIMAGLDVVDISASGAFASAGSVEQLASKDAAVQKANELKAAYVIVGTAAADKASESVAYGVNVVRCNAQITAKIVRASDGKVMAVEEASGTAGGQAILASGRDALKVAGEQIAGKLARAAKAAAGQ